MAAIPMLMMAGAAVSAIGAVGQAQAAKASDNYNATILERQAIVATDQAEQDAARVRRQGVQAQGSLIAGYGASGVATDEGSPMDALQMSMRDAKLDEETLRYKGQLKATGYRDEAALSRYGGKVAVQQGAMNAASYLIGGAGKSMATSAAGSRMTRTAGGYTSNSAYYDD